MKGWWAAAACAAAAGTAAAQDVAEPGQVELPTLTVTAAGEQGFYGPVFDQSAAGVMKTDTSILETPRSVSVVTQQQMQDRGARSLTQALQYTPGVMSGFGGNDNRDDWTYIRGFEPTIFLDGMQSTFGFYNNSRPEPFLLDSISVLKGPSGMLYGNGTVGGIINESSKLPDPEAPNIVELEFGSNNLFQSNIDMGGEFGDGRFLYRLVGLGRSADGPVDFSEDDAAAFMPSLTWAPSERTSLTILGTWQKNDTTPYIQFLSPYGTLWPAPEQAGGDFLPMDTFIGVPSMNYYDSERYAVSLFGDHRFDEVWGVGGSLRYAESSLQYGQAWWAYENFPTRYNPDGTINRWAEFQPAEYADNDSHALIGDLHATADFTAGPTEHAAMVGLGYTDGRFNYDYGFFYPDPIDPFDPVHTGPGRKTPLVDYPEYSLKQTSAYAQDRIGYGRVKLDLGLRYDRIESTAQTWDSASPTQELDDSEWSTSAALLYEFDNGIVPYVSYSESYFQEATGYDRRGNPFEPTRGTQYEAGVKYQPPGTSLLFTAAAYEITQSNVLVADPVNPNFSVQGGEAKSRGAELAAQGSWRGLSIDASYSYTDTEDENGQPLAGVPENMASAWLQYAFAGRLDGLDAGFGVRYVGSTFSWGFGDPDLDVTTPSFTLYDAMIGYTWDRYRVALTGRNLADETYVVNCSYSTCYYGDPRTIGLSLSAAF